MTAEAILILDQQGRIASASEAAAEFFGCSAQELTQNGLDPLLTVIGAPMPWSQILEQAAAHAAPAPMPCRVTGPHRTGPQIEAQVSLTPLPVGSEPRYLAVLRTPAERESRGSDAEVGDAQMRAMMDNSPVLTAYLGRDERYQFSNRAYAQWFGRSIEEVVGKDAKELLSESEYTAAQPYFQLALRGYPNSYQRESLVRGVPHWLQVTYIPDTGLEGKVEGVYLYADDITARKEAELALQASEAMLRTFADNSSALIAYVDASQRYQYVNRTWEDWFGIPPSEIVGRTVREIIADHYPFTQPYIERVLAGERVQFERTLDLKDGQRHVEVTFIPRQDEHGRTAGYYSLSVDVTARRKAADSHLRSQKMEALGTLAGGIAHDFNNILLAIIGNAKLAMEDVSHDHPAQESLREIDAASGRAADLVRGILTFSRQQEPKRLLIALGPVVEEAVRLLRSTLPAMLEIKTVVDADVPAVAADASQIHQIVMNLVTNAAHAIGDAKGTIGIRIDAFTVSSDLARISAELSEGRYARLSVSDDGIGMDQATLARIFDPFFTTKPVGQGTGLGLSAVHGIMKAHEGAITVYSQLRKGTTFRLYFPAGSPASSSTEDTSLAGTRGRGERLLYVDDEAALVRLTMRVLHRFGYEVTGYTDPLQAMDAFRSHPSDFDAVITDLSMPGISGFELARQVLEIKPDAVVVMTTGFVRAQDQERAFAMGIRALILKPDSVEELSDVLYRLLNEQKPPADET